MIWNEECGLLLICHYFDEFNRVNVVWASVGLYKKLALYCNHVYIIYIYISERIILDTNLYSIIYSVMPYKKGNSKLLIDYLFGITTQVVNI